MIPKHLLGHLFILIRRYVEPRKDRYLTLMVVSQDHLCRQRHLSTFVRWRSASIRSEWFTSRMANCDGPIELRASREDDYGEVSERT